MPSTSDTPKADATPVTAVVFDVGNVLIEWEPRLLYRKLIPDEREMERFLSEVTPPEWNLAQDAGRSWVDGVAEAIGRHPLQAELIRAYDERWAEMLGGPIQGSVDLLEELRAAGIPTFALTNFSREKWPIAVKTYDFLDRFDGVVVSGEERLVKPDHAIYRLLLERYGLDAASTFFTDDTSINALAAREVGMRAEIFLDPDRLRIDLRDHGLPV